MRADVHSETRQIHPRALADLGEEACIVALGVARDLRSGVIPPEEYEQTQICGSSCCIAGHIAWRMNLDASLVNRKRAQSVFYVRGRKSGDAGLADLFAGGHPSDPQLAADAIERFVYAGSETPWRA